MIKNMYITAFKKNKNISSGILRIIIIHIKEVSK